MTAPDAPRRLARVVTRHRELDAEQHWTQGVVTAVAARSVTVDVGGGSTITAARLRSYDDAKVGDVVWLAGPPGSWFCPGALA